MKKLIKVLSTVLALSITAVPFTQVAFADDEPATVCPFPTLQYTYTGMKERWSEAKEAGKPAARFFWYRGPCSGWDSNASAYYHGSKYIGENPPADMLPVLILLDNAAARTMLINHYKSQAMSEHVRILEENPEENLFIISYSDLEKISQTITLYTAFKEDVDIWTNYAWAKSVCCEGTLKKIDEDAEPWINPSDKIIAHAAQRDLRRCSGVLGRAWFAWYCSQMY